MPDHNESGGCHRPVRRPRRVVLTAIGVGLLVGTIFCLWAVSCLRDRRSADDRLAEIEAARAIPDSENAAILYNALLQDPNATLVMDDFPESPAGDVLNRVLREPWLSKDLPELTAWVRQHQFVIDKFMQALQFDKCRFPISIDRADMSVMDRAVPMRHWGYLLTVAAGNDLGEGRIDAAVTKWQCMLQTAKHLRQQPNVIDRLMAQGIELLAMRSLARFIVEDDPGEVHLQKIEAMALPITDESVTYCEEICLIDDLKTQKLLESFGPLDRFQYLLWRWRLNYAVFANLAGPDTQGDLRDFYLRYLAIRRGTRILVALKRYQRTIGQWPRGLDEIRSSLPDEVLIDPFNKRSFVYAATVDGFRLYSRGKNNIDENGKWESDAWDGKGCDDWPIWPIQGQDTEKDHVTSKSE